MPICMTRTCCVQLHTVKPNVWVSVHLRFVCYDNIRGKGKVFTVLSDVIARKERVVFSLLSFFFSIENLRPTKQARAGGIFEFTGNYWYSSDTGIDSYQKPRITVLIQCGYLKYRLSIIVGSPYFQNHTKNNYF